METQLLDREGTFRLEPASWEAKKYDSGSIGVSVLFRVMSQWFPGEGEWKDYPDGWEVYGQFFPIKKGGVLNERGAEDLMKYLGWNGDMTSWASSSWQANRCQGDVKAEEYNDVVRHRVQWLRYFDDIPGRGANAMSAEDLKSLQAQLGGPLRAIASNVVRDNTASIAAAVDGVPVAKPMAPSGDNIPF